MADEPSNGELGRDLERHETAIREIRRDYLPREVFQALVDQVRDLKQADTSERSGNRAWLLGLAQTVVGVVLGVAGGYLTARGGK